jgi:hypothetical protein
MADDLGQAILDLDADLAPLDAKMKDAKARVIAFVAQTQALFDSLHLDLDVGRINAAASAATAAQAAAGQTAGGAVAPAGGGSSGGVGGLWGVRGPSKAGSVDNPLVMVLEAAKNTPLGSKAAGIADMNTVDQQTGQGNLATAADLEALREQVRRFADASAQMSPASRLAEQGQYGLGMPYPTGRTINQSSTVTEAQTVAALQSAADSLAKIRGDLTTAERTRMLSAAPTHVSASTSSTGGAGNGGTRITETVYDYGNGGGAAGAAGGGRGGSGGGPPVSFNAPEPDGGGGSRRTDIYYHRDPASARTTYVPGRGLRTVEDGDNALSLANILRGDGGRGGALGLPGFGSVGSLAGLGLEHWLLTGLGLTASAGSAVAGAGLLGASGLTSMAVGGGADALINKDTLTQAKDMYTNVQALDEAIAVYGKGSKEAAKAQYALNQQWQQLGGGQGKQAIINLDSAAESVRKMFDTDSGGARATSASLMEQVLDVAGAYVKPVTSAAQTNLSEMITGLKPLFTWLKGPEGMGIFDTLEDTFAKHLPNSLNAFDMGLEDFLRLMQAASQYTGGFAKALDDFFTAKAGESTAQYDAEVQKLVGDLREWEALLKVLAEDMGGIFKADAGTADSIVREITQMLNKLHEWEQSTVGQTQLQNIFYVHKQEIDELLKVLPPLVKAYGDFYLTTAPPLVTALTDIAKAFTGIASAIEKLPGGSYLVGLSLVLGKLGLLGPGLKATAAAMALMTKAEAENVGPATADAGANTRLLASETGAAGGAEAGAAGGVIGLAERMGLKGGSAIKTAGLSTSLALAGAGATRTGAAVAGGASVLGDAAAVALPAVLTAGTAALILRWVNSDVLHLNTGSTSTATARNPSPTLEKGGYQSALPGFLGKGIDSVVNGTNSLFGVSDKGTLSIKTVGDYANYSTSELQKLINEIKKLNGVDYKVNGVSETKDEILGVTEAALKAKQGTDENLKDASSSVRIWAKDTGSSVGDLEDDFHTSMRAIVQYVGLGSASGKALMAQNVGDMIKALQKNMGDGKITVQSGMKAIDNALSVGTQTGVVDSTNRWQTMFSTITGLYSKHKIDTGTYMSDLHGIMQSGDKQIEAEVKASADRQASYYVGLQNKGVISTQQLATDTHQVVQGMAKTASSDMAQFSTNVLSQFASVANQGGTGLQDLVKTVNSFLKEMGATALPDLTVTMMNATNIAGAAGSTSGVYAIRAGSVGGGAAAGALYQIGQPGQAGRDSVPMTVGSTPIVVAPGEQVAVFNRHQAPIVNDALAAQGYDGLPGLFSNVTTPNYMAGGGMVNAPKVTGGGTLGRLTKSAMHYATNVANAFLGKQHAASGGAGGVSTTGLSGGLRSVVNQIAKKLGWGPAEVSAWLQVIARESGGSMTAQNPSSSAYGIAQFINGAGEYYTYGGNPNTLVGQLVAMANYIKQRYGTPSAAWGNELSAGYYNAGGMIPAFATGGLAPDNGNLGITSPITTTRPKLTELKSLVGPTGSGGDVGSLAGQLSFQQSQWGTSDPYFGQSASSFIISTDPTTGAAITPYIDQGAVSKTMGEYNTELGSYLNPSMSDLGLAERDTTQVLPKIASAIGSRKSSIADWTTDRNKRVAEMNKARAERVKALNKARREKVKALNKARAKKLATIRAQIRSNLQQIGAIQKTIAALQNLITAEEGKRKPNYKQIAAWKVQINGWQTKITALEKQNRDLGGDETDVGTGGEIWTVTTESAKDIQTVTTESAKDIASVTSESEKAVSKVETRYDNEIKAAQNQIASLTSTQQTLGGYGASLFAPNTADSTYGQDQEQKAQVQQQISQISPSNLQDALNAAALNAAGSSSALSSQSATEASLYQQSAAISANAAFIANNQLAALTSAISGGAALPPFGGSFKNGGIVPGAMGAPAMILAHGGEVVTPPAVAGGGAAHVTVHIQTHSGAEKFVKTLIEDHSRKQGRKPSVSGPNAGSRAGLLTLNRPHR